MFYLVSAIVVFVLILVISFAQFGASCSWYLFSPTTSPLLVLMQMSLLGMITGGLLVLYWKSRTEGEGGDEDGGAGED